MYWTQNQVPVDIKQLASRQKTPFVMFFVSLSSCIFSCLASFDKDLRREKHFNANCPQNCCW